MAPQQELAESAAAAVLVVATLLALAVALVAIQVAPVASGSIPAAAFGDRRAPAPRQRTNFRAMPRPQRNKADSRGNNKDNQIPNSRCLIMRGELDLKLLWEKRVAEARALGCWG